MTLFGRFPKLVSPAHSETLASDEHKKNHSNKPKNQTHTSLINAKEVVTESQ